MPAKGITNAMKWLIVIFAAAVVGLFIAAYYAVQSDMDLADVNNWMPWKVHRTTDTSSSSAQVPSDWKTFANQNYSYTIKYPGDWTAKMSSDSRANEIKYLDFVSNNSIECKLTYPAPAVGLFEGMERKNVDSKIINSIGNIRFNRDYLTLGDPNSNKNIYTYIAINDTEDRPVVFSCGADDGSIKIEDSLLEIFDNILSTFQFVR